MTRTAQMTQMTQMTSHAERTLTQCCFAFRQCQPAEFEWLFIQDEMRPDTVSWEQWQLDGWMPLCSECLVFMQFDNSGSGQNSGRPHWVRHLDDRRMVMKYPSHWTP